MKVIPFEPEKHMDQVNAWCRQWDHPALDSWISDTGAIVEGVAAGWVYLTNSNTALLDHAISNREVDASEALDAISLVLQDVARKAGALRVVGLTDLPEVAARAKEHGFRVAKKPHYLVIKTLEQPQ